MKALTAGLVFACTAACTGTLTGFLGGGLHEPGAWLALTLGFVAALLAGYYTEAGEKRPWSTGERILAVVFTLFALRSFFWVYFTSGDELRVLSPNNLGDMALHLTIINFLAQGAPFWPAQPIFGAQSLQYPIGVDLLNSLLVLTGLDLQRGLIWVGLAGATLTALALRRWGGAFALAGFLANGGLAGFIAIVDTIRGGHWALLDTSEMLAWKSIPLALFVTQRSLLYAIPAGLLLLISWRGRYFSPPPVAAPASAPDEKPAWRLPIFIEWLLYGTMPLFHVHTFLALSFVLGAWLLIVRGRDWRHLAGFIAASVAPATLMLWLVTAHFTSSSMIHFKAGWMPGGKTFFFWLLNFGVLPFLLAAFFYYAAKRRDRPALAFAAPAVLLFLICCFVMFAVWEWDNTKLMLWSYLIVLPFLWQTLIGRWPLWARLLTCVALFFSGFYVLVEGISASHRGHSIASRTEMDSLTVPLRTIPITATFASFPTYNHLLLLHGRKVVEGYDGHLFSYGIDYGETNRKLTALMNGSTDWQELARDLHVDYLFWGPMEQTAYPASPQPWKEGSDVVATNGSWTIYRLH